MTILITNHTFFFSIWVNYKENDIVCVGTDVGEFEKSYSGGKLIKYIEREKLK